MMIQKQITRLHTIKSTAYVMKYWQLSPTEQRDTEITKNNLSVVNNRDVVVS
jgi:hypothetical protein